MSSSSQDSFGTGLGDYFKDITLYSVVGLVVAITIYLNEHLSSRHQYSPYMAAVIATVTTAILDTWFPQDKPPNFTASVAASVTVIVLFVTFVLREKIRG